MPTVRLRFTPAPAHVRTARLVAVAVARRAGVAEELLDEIKLAVGEACSRAVALHHRSGLTDDVQLEMIDDERFTVRVHDRAPIDEGLGIAPPDPVALISHTANDTVAHLNDPTVGVGALAEEAVVAGVGLALLAGLVENLQVVPGPDGYGTEVSMSWPVGYRNLR